MGRAGIVILIVGVIVAVKGGIEVRVGTGSTQEAEAVSMADLENGEIPLNNHLRFTDHVAVYPLCIFEYETSQFDFNGPDLDSRVNYTYYPIMSSDNPWLEQLDGFRHEYGSLRNIPDTEIFGSTGEIPVLVKTTRFRKIRDLPAEEISEDSVRGLVINRIHSFSSEEKKLLQESFPRIDLETVLVLEEGRRPTPAYVGLGMMGGGIFLVLVAVGLFVFTAKQGNEATGTVEQTFEPSIRGY